MSATSIARDPCTRDPRLAREPDRRGRRLARVRRVRPRGRSVRRLDRRARGRRASGRRRRRGIWEGCPAGGCERERRDRACDSSGSMPRANATVDRSARRARRDADQEPAGSKRDPRLLARREQGGGCAQRCLALPLDRRSRGANAAGADDERDQRRCARAEPSRPPGVHGRPGGRGELLGGAPDRRRGLPPPARGSSRARARHRRRRRGGLRARSRVERGSHRGDPRSGGASRAS